MFCILKRNFTNLWTFQSLVLKPTMVSIWAEHQKSVVTNWTSKSLLIVFVLSSIFVYECTSRSVSSQRYCQWCWVVSHSTRHSFWICERFILHRKQRKRKHSREINILRDINDSCSWLFPWVGSQNVLRQTDQEISEMDKQINKEREQGLLPDKSQEF